MTADGLTSRLAIPRKFLFHYSTLSECFKTLIIQERNIKVTKDGRSETEPQQMLRPSAFVASVVPNKVFDPQHHVAFGDVFLENHMSAFEDEIEAITHGAGLPDRGNQGWITLAGKDLLNLANHWLAAVPANLSPGTGICGVRVEEISNNPIDLYAEAGRLCIGLDRTGVEQALTRLRSQLPSTVFTLTNETNCVGRIAVMGPDSRKLLQALGVHDDQLLNIGEHMEIVIIDEPVRVSRSDCAGPHGYDFIVQMESFNMILAVICSWGVRLGMNLVPVGWNAVQETARQYPNRIL